MDLQFVIIVHTLLVSFTPTTDMLIIFVVVVLDPRVGQRLLQEEASSMSPEAREDYLRMIAQAERSLKQYYLDHYLPSEYYVDHSQLSSDASIQNIRTT